VASIGITLLNELLFVLALLYLPYPHAQCLPPCYVYLCAPTTVFTSVGQQPSIFLDPKYKFYIQNMVSQVVIFYLIPSLLRLLYTTLCWLACYHMFCVVLPNTLLVGATSKPSIFFRRVHQGGTLCCDMPTSVPVPVPNLGSVRT
jgi:hypothetical protein